MSLVRIAQIRVSNRNHNQSAKIGHLHSCRLPLQLTVHHYDLQFTVTICSSPLRFTVGHWATPLKIGAMMRPIVLAEPSELEAFEGNKQRLIKRQ